MFGSTSQFQAFDNDFDSIVLNYAHLEPNPNKCNVFNVLLFMNESKIHTFLDVCIKNCPQDIPAKCLALLLKRMVIFSRDKIIQKSTFGLRSLICPWCKMIMTDPVTLKCGHTFSKQCLLNFQARSRNCPKCDNDCDISYVDTLNRDVTLSSVIEKILQCQLNNEKNVGLLLDEWPCRALIHTVLNNEYLRLYEPSPYVKELIYPLVYQKVSVWEDKELQFYITFAELRDAFIAYLLCYTLEQNADYAEIALDKALKIMYILYLNPCLPVCLDHQLGFGNQNATKVKFNIDLRSFMSLERAKIFEQVNPVRKDLHLLCSSYYEKVLEIAGRNNCLTKIDRFLFQLEDFECSLCMRLLYEPATTRCGHTFCRRCLVRSYDYQPRCPLCKDYLVADQLTNVNEIMEQLIQAIFPTEHKEREEIFTKEMHMFTFAGKYPSYQIPLFVCTVALPDVPCMLYVYEPRYKLMIRDCLESGGREFGMVSMIDNDISDYGVILKIQDIKFFKDGRAIVNAFGKKRFKIMRRGNQNGYHTASIKYIGDQDVEPEDVKAIREKNDLVYQTATAWFQKLSYDKKKKNM